MRAVFGADRAAAGAVWRDGKPVRIGSPRDAVRHGIALLTEDRKELGLLLPLSVRVNTTLTEVRSVARFGCIRPAADREATERMARMLSLRYSSPEQTVAELSGGNQQKVVVAKWLYCDCDVLLFDEPTRGIDVGAKFEVYALLADLASRGKAIVVVSSDLRELLSLCDRIAVMSAGRLVETFERGEFSQDAIMAAALSGYAKGAISA
jgi:ribose transport system ATP-binding protein